MGSFTLPYDIHSPDQISALTMELRHYIGARQDASRRSDHGASLQLPLSDQLSSLLEVVGNITTEQLLEELEAVLKNAPVVHIITGGQAGNPLKRQITVWFRDNIHPNTLLNFVQRHDLGGGVIVRAGSHIYDFSLKRQILDNKHRISELAFGAPAPRTAIPVQSAPERPASNVR